LKLTQSDIEFKDGGFKGHGCFLELVCWSWSLPRWLLSGFYIVFVLGLIIT